MEHALDSVVVCVCDLLKMKNPDKIKILRNPKTLHLELYILKMLHLEHDKECFRTSRKRTIPGHVESTSDAAEFLVGITKVKRNRLKVPLKIPIAALFCPQLQTAVSS